MRAILPAAAALTLALTANAFAQSTTTTPAPAPAPSAKPSDTTKSPSATTPSMTSPSTSAAKSASLVLTEAEAKAWIDKPIYSSDNKNVGEVAAFNRDASGKVIEMHADIGGFLGVGETRVKVEPAQFTASGDRIMLKLTSEQVKSLPKLTK